MEKLIDLIEKDPRLSLEELSVMLGVSQEEVAKTLDNYHRCGLIRGYKAIVDYSKLDKNLVKSIILLSVRPVKDHGFDEIGQRIASMDEVESVLLMSGGYDILVEIIGDSFQSIAEFVAKRLSPIESVLSTSTHFVLKTYKKDSYLYVDEEIDCRVNL